MTLEFEDDQDHSEILSYLSERGFSDEEIEKIVAKLKEYDEQMRHKSVFDSLEDGNFNLEKIIKEALS